MNMTNILLNIYGFDADWAYETLRSVLTPERRVCVLTMSHGQEIPDGTTWEKLYGPGGAIYRDLVAPFGSYGIPEEQISWVSWFHDTPETAQEKLRKADVLFLTGGLPDVFFQRLQGFGLVEAIRRFQGIVMGASAGAMVQFREYHITPDEDYSTYGYYPGLGLLNAFELEVHYTGSLVQREAVQRYLHQRKKPLYAMCNDGGLLVQDGVITPMGNVTLETGGWK
jgi:hypothetical protein